MEGSRAKLHVRFVSLARPAELQPHFSWTGGGMWGLVFLQVRHKLNSRAWANLTDLPTIAFRLPMLFWRFAFGAYTDPLEIHCAVKGDMTRFTAHGCRDLVRLCVAASWLAGRNCHSSSSSSWVGTKPGDTPLKRTQRWANSFCIDAVI